MRDGTAWVELWTAEEAKALHRLVTQTEKCTILGKTIKTAAIYQGRVKVPEGPDFIRRSLYIAALPAFLDGELELNRVLQRKLKKQGFTKMPVGQYEGETATGSWVEAHYQSVAVAQSAKAALEKHFPELVVIYVSDHCESVPSSTREGAGVGSGSSKEPSAQTILKAGFTAAFGIIVGIIEALMGKPSDKNGQQKKQDK